MCIAGGDSKSGARVYSLSMRKTTFAVCLAVLWLAAACRVKGVSLAGSRSVKLGTSSLVTEYRKDPSSGEFALLHVLFVPERDVPAKEGYGHNIATGGTVETYELKFEYVEDNGTSIRAQPVKIRNGELVAAGGRTFSLTRGNVFIAHVAPDGATSLTQLPMFERGRGTSAKAIVKAIQAAAPREDRRVQGLDVKG